MKRVIIPLVAAGCVLAAAAPALAVRDYSSTALNVIPSGQYGGVPIPPKADDQARLYDGLTPLFDRISNRQLFRWFKSEKLGTEGPGTADARARAAQGRAHHPGPGQRAAHLRPNR